MNRSRSEGSGITATETLRPARLKVLLGAIRVMVRRSISGASEAIGTWRWPPKSRSQWISSAMIGMSRSRQIRAIPASSSRVKTRPTGLCGLQRMNARVRGWIAARTASRSAT